MIDRLFCAMLTFCLLAGGTTAIVHAARESSPAPAATVQAAMTLPPVVVTVKRAELAKADAPTRVQ